MKVIIRTVFFAAVFIITSYIAVAAPDMPEGGWFYGVCETHGWSGHARATEIEARRDAAGHRDLYPDESHKLRVEQDNGGKSL